MSDWHDDRRWEDDGGKTQPPAPPPQDRPDEYRFCRRCDRVMLFGPAGCRGCEEKGGGK